MAKIGDGIPHLIERAIDFMASTQGVPRVFEKTPPRNTIPSDIPEENVPLYLQRLEYYRQLYRPK